MIISLVSETFYSFIIIEILAKIIPTIINYQDLKIRFFKIKVDSTDIFKAALFF